MTSKRFGRFELDGNTRELRLDGNALALQSRIRVNH
jgi:hypothetical protein